MTGGALSDVADEALTIEGNGSSISRTCDGVRVMTLTTPNQILTINDRSIAGRRRATDRWPPARRLLGRRIGVP